MRTRVLNLKSLAAPSQAGTDSKQVPNESKKRAQNGAKTEAQQGSKKKAGATTPRAKAGGKTPPKKANGIKKPSQKEAPGINKPSQKTAAGIKKTLGSRGVKGSVKRLTERRSKASPKTKGRGKNKPK